MKYTDVSEKIQHQLDKIKSIESRYKAHKGSCVEQVRFLLAKHRKSLGVTLTEVSKKIKMCPSAAWQIENGNMAISSRVIKIYMSLKAPKKVNPRSKGYGSRSTSKPQKQIKVVCIPGASKLVEIPTPSATRKRKSA